MGGKWRERDKESGECRDGNESDRERERGRG